ncbi:hypothetical protein GE09DRAFT_544705 [Coniochaeta sp. 2T2.1]|nr:hypothetical protein GE09DRAFT_544705 [Coniochaeta sp. 2T2.1]
MSLPRPSQLSLWPIAMLPPTPPDAREASPADNALSHDTSRLPRQERAMSIDRDDEDEGKATIELASIMMTASNPVSPGPSSPPLEQSRTQEFVPPARPSSTPFPQPEHRTDIRCMTCPADEMVGLEGPGMSEILDMTAPLPAEPTRLSLNDLPAEIHECILDHLFGFRVSTTSKSSIVRWGTALRHSRRKELSELALVSPVWRTLIQERLYRHLKIKATTESLNDLLNWFVGHDHLRPYVKHVELWFPVFEPKYSLQTLANLNTLPTVTVDGLTQTTYTLPADNCSLMDAFQTIGVMLPDVCVLTLEGGERKKAPKVRLTSAYSEIWMSNGLLYVPKLLSVRTLITKGQWNLIRSDKDFDVIMSSLPNLQEWHGFYSKPKSKSYLTMATILPKLPTNLTNLELNIEGDYRRELNFPSYFLKVSNKLHFCKMLADAAPALEHLSYTGRVCRVFFDLVAAHTDPRTTKLKTIDLTVKNCCRHVTHWNESGSGITDMNFIRAYESLVIAGIRSLTKLKALQYLRIRFVDLGMSSFPLSFPYTFPPFTIHPFLRTAIRRIVFSPLLTPTDSPIPQLNPFFTLHKRVAQGVWSDDIVQELNRARPGAKFEYLDETFGEIVISKDGRFIVNPNHSKSKVTSLKLDNYALLTGVQAVAGGGISIT